MWPGAGSVTLTDTEAPGLWVGAGGQLSPGQEGDSDVQTRRGWGWVERERLIPEPQRAPSHADRRAKTSYSAYSPQCKEKNKQLLAINSLIGLWGSLCINSIVLLLWILC